MDRMDRTIGAALSAPSLVTPAGQRQRVHRSKGTTAVREFCRDHHWRPHGAQRDGAGAAGCGAGGQPSLSRLVHHSVTITPSHRGRFKFLL